MCECIYAYHQAVIIALSLDCLFRSICPYNSIFLAGPLDYFLHLGRANGQPILV